MSEEVVSERRGNVLLARLNRPAVRNALNAAMMERLGAAIHEAETDPEIRVLVVTGTGERAFCVGMDLRAFAEGERVSASDPEAMQCFSRLMQGQVSVPVVGAANATALGGGFELLLGCDLIVASSQAQFGFPEVKRGLFPAGCGTSLGTRIPLAIALEMTLTGEPISAERAHGLGLVNAVVAPDEVVDTALAFAKRIAANGPLALAAVKELVRLGVSDPARASERLSEWQKIVFGSEDAKEGARAFVEKRAPVWKGR